MLCISLLCKLKWWIRWANFQLSQKINLMQMNWMIRLLMNLFQRVISKELEEQGKLTWTLFSKNTDRIGKYHLRSLIRTRKFFPNTWLIKASQNRQMTQVVLIKMLLHSHYSHQPREIPINLYLQTY